jgi:peptidoglycan/xylan/chitin deacetylase (PgdA/CDA1 family)
VQRIGRRRAHLTRVEKRFRGWHHMLLNGIANFALERGAARLRSPTAAWAMAHTDRARTVQRALFERVYDRDLHTRFPRATRNDRWWEVSAAELAAQCLRAERGAEPLRRGKTICLFHDVERGLGHRDVDPAFAAAAERDAPAHLDAMLAIEQAAGVRATYDVVGILLPEVRDRIAAGGHCLAFHSYDHPPAGQDHGQLRACRTIDYRLKGYRVPRSELTDEVSTAALCRHNFEWLASASRTLGITEPAMQSGIVRIPIVDDDFPLHTGQLRYPEWEARVLDRVRAHPFAAIGLHDCYAASWLPHYPGLLEALRKLGTLRTADDVAFDVIFRHAA